MEQKSWRNSDAGRDSLSIISKKNDQDVSGCISGLHPQNQQHPPNSYCALDLPQGAMLLNSLHVQQLRDGCVIPQVLPRVAHVRAHQQRPTLQLAADPAAVGTTAPLELVVETSAHHLEGFGWIPPVLDGSFCLVSNRSSHKKCWGESLQLGQRMLLILQLQQFGSE